jgi:hypothetical protein
MGISGDYWMIVDWKRGELRPQPIPSQPSRRNMFYPAKCPICHTEVWRRACDLKALKTCLECSRVKAGIGGRGGATAAARRFEAQARTYRRRPNRPERRVRDWLIDIGIGFQSQKVITLEGNFYILDFFLHLFQPRVVEVVGFWHKHDPDVRKRDRRLARVIDYPILFLDSDEIMDQPEIARKRLFRWIQC